MIMEKQYSEQISKQTQNTKQIHQSIQGKYVFKD